MLRRDILRFIEASAVGWFFLQAARMMIATLYARVSSAEIAWRIHGTEIPAGRIGPGQVQLEIAITLALIVAGPLLGAVLSRWRYAPTVGAVLAAIGRVFMTVEPSPLKVFGGALVLMAGLLYWTALAHRWPSYVPYGIAVGLALDPLLRAVGDSRDISFDPAFLPAQTVISLVAFVVAFLTAFSERDYPSESHTDPSKRGTINGWSALALGGILYLEMVLLGLPNAVARTTGISYATAVPIMLIATTLPLIPEVRTLARHFASLFHGQFRGWVWFLLAALLLAVGHRFDGFGAALALAFVQGLAVLSLWWIVQPLPEGRANTSGWGVLLAVIVFALLALGNFFTFEYAFVGTNPVRLGGVALSFGFLAALRGMGLALMLVAAVFMAFPMILARTRIPWRAGKLGQTVLMGLLTVGVGVGGWWAARPSPSVVRMEAETFRVGTYNIHAGYSLYFENDLEALAQNILASGADVVLLQEVEAGRLTSFGTDQALWLARRLGMLSYYFPTNEMVAGLAVLSRFPIERAEGVLLPSEGLQTGAQRVRLNAGGEALDVYNVWLGLIEADAGGAEIALQEQDQFIQVQEFLRFIAQQPMERRIIAGGTFNAPPGTPVTNEMASAGFDDPFEMLPDERAATLRRGERRVARYDYVWLRGLEVVGVDVMTPDPSDHRLAVAEVSFKPPNPPEDEGTSPSEITQVP